MRPRTFNHRVFDGPTQPMSDLNVTPFIDVLLVLIIMLIMTVPVLTHSTDIDLPNGTSGPVNPDINVVGITPGGALLWNGTQVSERDLRASVISASALPSEPVLRFDPADTAPYGVSAKTIALIKESGAQKFAFARLHEHREFSKAD